MQILLISQEPQLTDNDVATGNSIRTAQLAGALGRAGHRLQQVWLNPLGERQPGDFKSRDELHSLIIKHQPDIILIAYWELLGLLPFELTQPVIVDFVAPRPLEELFEHPEKVSAELKRLQRYLVKADLLLTGNSAQRELLWFTLIQAGFDLREQSPVLVVPLAAEVAGKPQSNPEEDGWTLVGGGVNWPWRSSEAYWESIQAMAPDAPELTLFGGSYRFHQSSSGDDQSRHQTRALTSYAEFSRYLIDSTHIGLEVAQPNIERSYSQSFRSLEFLRHGLPLICNDYLPIAKLVNQYDAGWTVKDPEDLEALLRKVMSDPEEWRKRSANAHKLVSEVLNPDVVIQGLLEWLRTPSKVTRLPVSPTPPAPAVLGKPGWGERLKRQARLLRRIILAKLFRSRPGKNVLIVTRKDIFPDDHGAAVKIVETARGLSQHGPQVGVVSDDPKHWWLFENGKVQRQSLPFWLRFLSLPQPLAKLLHLSSDIPESNSFLYFPFTTRSFFWHCLYVGKKLNAGILQAEFPAYAKPCIEAREILDAAVVLVEHNVEYVRLKNQIPELSEPQFLNLQAMEIDLCNRSDAVICVSDNDRQQLLADGVSGELMRTIPHGFNPDPFKLPPKDTIRQKFGIPEEAVLLAFHGTFSYPPNRMALQVFAEILLPKLEGADRPFHVIAIGRNPPAESLHANIHVTGSVDEVGPWLKGCDLAVIPLTEGGGTRMKIIDCFAADLPVISTSKGIEGIPVVNQAEAIIADDWDEMVDDIVRLSGSKPERDALSSAARRFSTELDWKSIAGRYIKVFETIRRSS